MRSLGQELRLFLSLAMPLAAAQVAQSATGFVDTLMMGWMGPEVLAAGGLSSITLMTILLIALGVVAGVGPLMAEAFGAGKGDRLRTVFQQGLWLAALLAVPVVLGLHQLGPVLERLGQSPETIAIGQPYLTVMRWGFLPAVAFGVLRSALAALGQARPVLGVVVVGTLINGVGNYLLGFGKLGFPGLGISGLAMASVLSQWFMAIALLVYLWRGTGLRSHRLFAGRWALCGGIFRRLLGLGVPIAIGYGLETLLFTIGTYLAGALGTTTLAAHQIVFQTILVVFMVPLGMSFAATALVGKRQGQWQRIHLGGAAGVLGRGLDDAGAEAGTAAGTAVGTTVGTEAGTEAGTEGEVDGWGVRRAAWVSVGGAAGFMTVMAGVLLLFPRMVVGLYIDPDAPQNAAVVAQVLPMLRVAAIAQIADGVQKTAQGALQGLQDVRVPTLLSLASFWGVGLTSGWWLGFGLGWGGTGLWLGQSIGVAVAATLFVLRLRWVMGKSEG